MTRTVDQRLVASDQIKRHGRAEIAAVDRHSLMDFGRQLGRRADEDRDVVTGGDRLTQHVAAQRSGGAQDDNAGHQIPTSLIPRTNAKSSTAGFASR